jgi:hypothetical protein
MMRPLLLLLASWLVAGCTSTFYRERGNTVIIYAGFGGDVRSIEARYARWLAEGRELVIDGHVISADAIEAFSYPGACYTERAIFSPHAYSDARWLGLRRLRGETERAAKKLPEPLEQFFRGNMAFYDPVGFAVVDHDQLLTIWPEGACNKSDVDRVTAAD